MRKVIQKERGEEKYVIFIFHRTRTHKEKKNLIPTFDLSQENGHRRRVFEVGLGTVLLLLAVASITLVHPGIEQQILLHATELSLE